MISRRWSLAALILAAACAVGWKVGQRANVQVESVQLRSEPSFFLGKAVGEVKFADALQVLESRPGWVKVRSGEASGWVSESALTVRTVALPKAGEAVHLEADESEVLAAVRGWNKEVELDYRRSHAELDYTVVDQMETEPQYQVGDDEVLRFLQEGGVR